MTSDTIEKIKVIDSHTGGEPTRVVVEGMPDLGDGSMAERLEVFKNQYDDYRSAIVNEPRGSDVIVGALYCQPQDPNNTAGVIFFNNTGYLGMCGHGSMGFLVTLYHMGNIELGEHRIETPVGVITATLESPTTATINNVVSYREKKAVVIDVPELGHITGDLAWGGNWFYISGDHGIDISQHNITELSRHAEMVKRTLLKQGVVAADQEELLHVEFYQPSTKEGVQVKNFVYCPGGEFDRSPCGTGTSAKMACLVADGKMREGDIWRQESVVGSVFEGSVTIIDDEIHPHVKGSAHVSAETTLLLHPEDPFKMGMAFKS